jgi:hypothetical protein
VGATQVFSCPGKALAFGDGHEVTEIAEFAPDGKRGRESLATVFQAKKIERNSMKIQKQTNLVTQRALAVDRRHPWVGLAVGVFVTWLAVVRHGLPLGSIATAMVCGGLIGG